MMMMSRGCKDGGTDHHDHRLQSAYHHQHEPLRTGGTPWTTASRPSLIIERWILLLSENLPCLDHFKIWGTLWENAGYFRQQFWRKYVLRCLMTACVRHQAVFSRIFNRHRFENNELEWLFRRYILRVSRPSSSLSLLRWSSSLSSLSSSWCLWWWLWAGAACLHPTSSRPLRHPHCCPCHCQLYQGNILYFHILSIYCC